ncbi:MAG: amidohydrolase family protein [Candidatus Caldarchaeum sp.]|nr:amidohydrolase family protein [Candidatus Caldarchaeum sp.]MDW8360238.1 amidohydrolase family protein [Candidatus Caldarchaeum sp.]
MPVDVHNHWYPVEYLKVLAEHGGRYGWVVVNSPDDVPVIKSSRGYIFRCTKATNEAQARVAEMDAGGLDTQIMSISEPWVDFLPPPQSIRLAQMVNDDIARACERFPGRLEGMATVPMNDVEASVDELKRCKAELGLKGVIIPTRVNGEEAISASKHYPIFETACRLGMPVFIHPALPPGSEAMRQNLTGLMVGYPAETTLVVADLIVGGLLDRLPQLKILLADLGGALPYVAGRMVRFYEAFDELRRKMAHDPLHYLSMLYYENGAAAHPTAMDYLYRLVGPKRIMLGSNHPSPIGHFTKCIESIKNMDVPDHEKTMMLHRNAAELFQLSM